MADNDSIGNMTLLISILEFLKSSTAFSPCKDSIPIIKSYMDL